MVPAALKADADLPAVCVCSGPNSIAKCSIDPQPDGQYAVTYIPVEVGMFDVQVKWNGTELPGEWTGMSVCSELGEKLPSEWTVCGVVCGESGKELPGKWAVFGVYGECGESSKDRRSVMNELSVVPTQATE